jgi:FlaA1/EpsC-like NDP-sugar epimerase
MFKGKKVLVTGATGSFGHHIVKELVKKDVSEIIVFSRDEKKQHDMKFEFAGETRLRYVIGDIREKDSLRRIMDGVDIVYQAAALKHVPACEENVWQAVQTNITGAQNVVDVSLEANVEKVVAISTDKAVEPVNVMGMTKAIQERIFIGANKFAKAGRPLFSCVRYGNVLGSRGSILPVFRMLASRKQPLTITDPRMTRFILTLDEAIELVIFATEQMVGGEIFIPKIAAHKVTDLAEAFIEVMKPENRTVKTIGIRPGEKIHETLIAGVESLRTVELKDYYVILPQIHLDSIEKKYPGFLNPKLFAFSSENAEQLPKAKLADLLRSYHHTVEEA